MRRWLERLTGRGEPDLTLRRADGGLYLKRWWIVLRSMNRWNLYLHNFLGDDEQDMHDHPGWNLSIVLWGGYWEITLDDSPAPGVSVQTARLRKRGSIIFRRATRLHRVVMRGGPGAWTLFVSGRKVRNWGFVCPDGRWVDWQTYLAFDGEGSAYTGEQRATRAIGCGETDDA